MVKTPYIAISGGFDPLHSGHIDYIEGAASYGRVLVILNTNDWLFRKKGFVFMDWNERSRILSGLRDVDCVYEAYDDDETVCRSLEILSKVKHILYFGNGGDRKMSNTPEAAVCKKLGIKMVFGLGGNKTQSSSQLVRNVQTGG